MAHGDAREGTWRGNWRMEWVASTLHTTSEHGVSSITTADAHTSAANSRLNWCPRRFKWTRPFRRKTNSCFCACAITFQLASTHFCQRLIQPQGHSAVGRIMSMKNSSDTIGNRTRDLLTCSTVPQPTALRRAPSSSQMGNKNLALSAIQWIKPCGPRSTRGKWKSADGCVEKDLRNNKRHETKLAYPL